MKKRLLSIVTTMALCLSLLSAAALAEEHICTDEEHDHWCDACGEVVYRTDPLDSGCYACEDCDAVMVGIGSVTILHGKGTGALKEEIRRYLRSVKEVATVTDEHADRGGAGITIVTFHP